MNALIQSTPGQTTDAAAVKSCCATLYENDVVKLLVGDSFHPGGLTLTERLGHLLDLQPGQRILDVAAGQGTSAIFLAQHFGCEVVGVDYGAESVQKAQTQAEAAGMSDLVRFEQGDAEKLRFEANSFDAIICECAFCTFPDKSTAGGEFARVLRPGGRVGLSDLTRAGPLPPELEGILAWITCVADARPIDEYVSYLEGAGLKVSEIEPHNAALAEMVKNIRTKLLGAEVLLKLKMIDLPLDIDFRQAKSLIRHATEAIQQGRLGYALVVGEKPDG